MGIYVRSAPDVAATRTGRALMPGGRVRVLERRRVAATRSPDFCALLRAFFASVLDRYERVPYGAGKGCEIPKFKGSSLGRFPLVSADFWTGDHLSERSRRVDAFGGTRARG